jgi:hypothetical protein
MAESLDFAVLWPVAPGRFGWTARGNSPCLMEIVSWLTLGTIDPAWPGVSPGIAEYVQAAQDAMDDTARQELLVLVPPLMHCADADDPPDIESARRVLLAEKSLSRLVPLVLDAAGRSHEAEALSASAGSFARLQAPLHAAAESAPANPFLNAVMECAQKLVVCVNDGRAARQAQLSLRTTQLAVSVIQCNDAPARRLLLGERPRMRLLEFLEQAIISIIEEAIGSPRQPPPFADPWDVLEAGERFKAAMAQGFPPIHAQLEPRRFER